ncbi:hypothetical protein GJ496_010145 [Pomphorhynchus laevis]|nr:hypothetical protein GJ496_010145 [Pomphorhynchus laevis]
MGMSTVDHSLSKSDLVPAHDSVISRLDISENPKHLHSSIEIEDYDDIFKFMLEHCSLDRVIRRRVGV